MGDSISSKPKHIKKQRRGPRVIFYIICGVLLVVFCFSAFKLTDGLLKSKHEKEAFEELAEIVAKNVPATKDEQTKNTSDKNPDSNSSDDSKGSDALVQYVTIYEMNNDFFGWISIDGTKINYPVMYSPDSPEYYINHAFDGSVSVSGVPFVDSRCSTDGKYFLIYGHHMNNKTMFGELPYYADQSYCEAHSVINFDVLNEEREYQVVAAFYSKVYDEKETDKFRYYDYYDLSDKDVFEDYARQVKNEALYDTGIELNYGDELITLSTCNYHTKDGRFVVVAKRIG